MPAFTDIATGKTPAAAQDIQQVIDALTGRRNTPLATIVNDPLSYALSLRNSDAASRGLVIFASDGSTVLLSVDATGVRLSKAGAAATVPLIGSDVGSAAGQVAGGDHVHGTSGYSGGSVSLESLYANSWVTTGVSYVVAAGIQFVFCTLGVTVTLPVASGTNRPILVSAIAGTTTVIAAGGSVIGGSINTSTGAVMNGTISPGDALTYKSDSTNWRAI